MGRPCWARTKWGGTRAPSGFVTRTTPGWSGGPLSIFLSSLKKLFFFRFFRYAIKARAHGNAKTPWPAPGYKQEQVTVTHSHTLLARRRKISFRFCIVSTVPDTSRLFALCNFFLTISPADEIVIHFHFSHLGAILRYRFFSACMPDHT